MNATSSLVAHLRRSHIMQLTLPPAFGFAYVGENFSCTLCANNELPDGTGRVITSAKIVAEMQTPSQVVQLPLSLDDGEVVENGLKPGESVQRIVRFDLREEGNHVLAVTVSYSETAASSGRVRSFRKLYQFNAQRCLSVRTEASELTPVNIKSRTANLARYALEAQLENMADSPIVLQDLTLEAKSPFRSKSLNWDIPHPDLKYSDLPILAPHEVTQVAFLVEEDHSDGQDADIIQKELTKDGRIILGQLRIQWRGAMGDPGILSTGWLTSGRR